MNRGSKERAEALFRGPRPRRSSLRGRCCRQFWQFRLPWVCWPALWKAGLSASSFPGCEVSAWQGIVAPAKISSKIIEKLNARINSALKDPAVKEKLNAAGIEPIQSTPDAFASCMRSETQRWRDVIHAANISLNRAAVSYAYS